MNRLVGALGWDVRLQFRQGIYYAALFVILIWVIGLTQLPAAAIEWLLPFAIFMDLSVFGFYFMSGILFLEKGEGVLEALVVTPMRQGEYLASKLISLTLLAVITTVVVVMIGRGVAVNWVLLLIGVLLNSWLMVLVGFILAARYNAINEFIIPSLVFMIPSQLPLLALFGIWDSWWLYLIPTQATMLLIAGAFEPIAGWQIAYALVYLAVSSSVVTWLALRAFEKFVVRHEMS